MASSSSACTVPSVYCFARRKPKACGRPYRWVGGSSVASRLRLTVAAPTTYGCSLHLVGGLDEDCDLLRLSCPLLALLRWSGVGPGLGVGLGLGLG